MAGHSQLAAAAQGKAVDRSDHRLVKPFDQEKDILPPPGHLSRGLGIEIEKLLDVGAGDKSLFPGSRQDDPPEVLPCGRILAEQVAQLKHGLRIEGVQGFLPVDRSYEDAVFFTN